MTIHTKVFYFPPSLSELISRFGNDEYNYYCLKPMESDDTFGDLVEEDVEQLDKNGLATVKGWPAECTTEELYWKRVNAYPGGTLQRTAVYVHNLLNDEKLNLPSKSISLESKYGGNLPLLDQTMHDLRRRDRVTINGKVVFDMSTPDDSIEIFMKNWTDERKAKHTFKECMKVLHKNYHLTTNALKLSTQASLARLTRLIMPRFSNPQLEDPKLILCGVQRVAIDTREEAITRIFYHSFWGIVTMENPRKPIKHIKGSVEFVIGTDDLVAGKAGKAMEFERCTPFFDTFEEVEQCGVWPADAETPDLYDKRVELFPSYSEHLHPLISGATLKHLTENKDLSIANCIECSIQSQYLPLKKLTLFTNELYNANSLISKLPNQGEFISGNIWKYTQTPELILNRLFKLSCLGIGELLTKIAYSRFSKPSIDRHVTCYDNRLTIEQSETDDNYRIISASKWHSSDMSKDDVPPLTKFGILLTATITENELISRTPENIDITLEIRTF